MPNNEKKDRSSPSLSIRELRQWVDFGHPRALIEMGYRLAFGKRRKHEGDLRQAVEYWSRAADIGLPEAQLLTGACYDFGFGTRKHPLKAMQWYMKAAWQEDPEAAYFVALGYRDGTGFKRNVPIAAFRPQAEYWFYESAMAGNAYAQNELGLFYMMGTGNFHQDIKEAITLFRKAAAQEMPYAMKNLAQCYLKGHGVRKNRSKADTFFTKALETFKSLSANQPHSLHDLVIQGEDFRPVVRETLCLIKAGVVDKNLELLRKEITLGLEDLASGKSELTEGVTLSPDEIKPEGRKRLASTRGKASKTS